MPEVDLFGDNNIPKGTEIYDARIGKIQSEIHNYLRQGVVPGAIQQILTKLDNISIDADSVNLNTDQLETKLDTLNALVTTLQVDVADGITANSPNGSLTVRSGTIATGGTSQQIAASNATRKYFAIQNVSDTDMYLGVGFTPTATTGIILSKNGGGFVFESNFIPTQAINLLCATTGKAFVAWEG